MTPEYLKPREAAAALGVNVHSIYRWIKDGQLEHRRIGPTGKSIRIPSRVVSDMLTQHNTDASL